MEPAFQGDFSLDCQRDIVARQGHWFETVSALEFRKRCIQVVVNEISVDQVRLVLAFANLYGLCDQRVIWPPVKMLLRTEDLHDCRGRTNIGEFHTSN